MALKLSKTISGEAVIQDKFLGASPVALTVTDDLYIKVERVIATKELANAVVSFTSPMINGTNSYEFKVALNGGNFIAQAYEYLKLLPEFADAIEC